MPIPEYNPSEIFSCFIFQTKGMVHNEQDASLALDISTALTKATMAFRMKSMGMSAEVSFNETHLFRFLSI